MVNYTGLHDEFREDGAATWQMSDHSPLWIEIRTDFAESYLEQIVAGP